MRTITRKVQIKGLNKQQQPAKARVVQSSNALLQWQLLSCSTQEQQPAPDPATKVWGWFRVHLQKGAMCGSTPQHWCRRWGATIAW